MSTITDFAATDARYRRWDQTAARNADIRSRVRSGEPVEKVAAHYGIAQDKARRIAGLFGS
jgi:hypothetical protein